MIIKKILTFKISEKDFTEEYHDMRTWCDDDIPKKVTVNSEILDLMDEFTDRFDEGEADESEWVIEK